MFLGYWCGGVDVDLVGVGLYVVGIVVVFVDFGVGCGVLCVDGWYGVGVVGID